MSTGRQHQSRLVFIIAAFLMLAACAQTSVPEGSANVRNKLNALQANQELTSRAPLAMKEAEEAVRAAEIPQKDEALARHRVVIADQKVDIAAARAQARLYEDQRTELSKASERARLDSRAKEANSARMDANLAREDARLARGDAEAARLKEVELKRQLDELNAKETERGIVITLGDVLFATGRSELTGGAPERLRNLAGFLSQYPDRSVVIEGHTDSVGSATANFGLSQRRADTVRSFLADQGVPANRMRTTGLGEENPVASNDSATGRQQNRRVEVIIENNRQPL